jgi:hypothetical protein
MDLLCRICSKYGNNSFFLLGMSQSEKDVLGSSPIFYSCDDHVEEVRSLAREELNLMFKNKIKDNSGQVMEL